MSDDPAEIPKTPDDAFEYLLELGEGGMGTVVLARSRGVAGFERLVALKRMKPMKSASPNFEERFIREAKLAAQVRHANVVAVQQLGRDGEGLFLVLDYVEGASLGTLVERCTGNGGRPPPPIALRIVSDALSGLQAVHDATDSTGRPLEILHRDVSTHNIMVGRDGISRLTDFGVAKSTTQKQLTEAHQLFGKVLWMPPEYLRSEPVDRRLDVYAMGVTLWIALASVEPWPDADHTELVSAILREGIPPLSSSGISVAPELEELVARATAPLAADRFASASEMRSALEDLVRTTGWTATQSEVAAFVEELEGRRLASRRAAIAGRGPISRVTAEAPTLAGDEPITTVKNPLASREPTALGLGPSSANSRPSRNYGGGTRLGIGSKEPPLVPKVARPRLRDPEPDVPLTSTKRTWVVAAIASVLLGVIVALLLGR